jgi:hypothetical protein
MNRFVAIIAATAAAAAVAAAISLPAGADETPSSDAGFVSCLRSHGAGIPADAQGAAIKTWLIAHKGDAGVEGALKTCAPDTLAPEQLTACLRDHGLEPPASLEELKPWIAGQFETDAGKAALKACNVDMRPSEKAVAGPADVEKFAKCLRDNGASVPEGADGVALKTWLRDHENEATVNDALKLCAGGFEDGKKPGGCGGDVRPAPGDPAPGDPAPKDPATKSTDTVTLEQ